MAGLLDVFIGRKSVSIEDRLWAELSLTGQAKSGLFVSHDAALKCATALACTRVLSQGIAQVPLKLYQRTGERTSRIADEHSLHRILHRRPNEWQTSFQWRETMMLHAVLTGAGRSFINRNGRGEIVELIPFLPAQVTVTQSPQYVLSYEVNLPNGSKVTLPREQVFDLRGPSWNAYQGLDAVHLAREAIGLALATEETHARLHGNGARPSGILSTDQVINNETANQIREAWQQHQAGLSNTMKTAFLHGGFKWQSMAMTGVDSQHIETRKYQIEEICRALGVFPQMVGHTDKTATFASAEQFFIAHVVHSLQPWVERWEETIDCFLLSERELDQGYFAEFTMNGLLRGSAKDRAAFYTALYNIGSLNPNEIRGYEGLDAYEGGDQFRVPLNTEDPTNPEPRPEPGGENGTD